VPKEISIYISHMDSVLVACDEFVICCV